MSITNVLTFKTSDPTLIDARGPRFGAVITTIVLTAFLATEARVLLHWQLLVFALGAFFGLKYSPYGFIYSKLVKPRLRGEVPTEDAPATICSTSWFYFCNYGDDSLRLGP
jgi:hypothetical protein